MYIYQFRLVSYENRQTRHSLLSFSLFCLLFELRVSYMNIDLLLSVMHGPKYSLYVYVCVYIYYSMCYVYVTCRVYF